MQNLSVSASNAKQHALALGVNELSSGKRITSAAVDPAALVIVNTLQSQAAGFDQGAVNAQSAIDAGTIAQGAIVTISDAAQTLNRLAVAANNDFLSAGDRANLQTQANQTTTQIDSVAGSTQFNGLSLLDGTTPSAAVQTGAGEGAATALTLPASGAAALGLAAVDLSSSAAATTSEYAAGAATASIGSAQAELGSQAVALQTDQQNSANHSANLTASASDIADADIGRASTTSAAAQAQAQIQIALQVQAGLAASSFLGLFPH